MNTTNNTFLTKRYVIYLVGRRDHSLFEVLPGITYLKEYPEDKIGNKSHPRSKSTIFLHSNLTWLVQPTMIQSKIMRLQFESFRCKYFSVIKS